MSETGRIKCPQCKQLNGGDVSRENLAIYDDGSKWCYSCGYWEAAKGKKNKGVNMRPLIAGVHEALDSRGITLATCQKYNVRQIDFTGVLTRDYELENEKVRIYPIYKDGRVVKQKVKSVKDKKKMGQFGDTSCLSLFGMNTFTPSDRVPVIVTEGEEDAMAAFQMMGMPAVSITRGADGAFKELTSNLEWLSGFKEVILCFDSDEPGRKAVSDCINIFEPGTVRNALLPVKDANDMLLQNREEEFKKCIWNAESIKPPTIVFIKDIRDQILTPPQYGNPWPWPAMTKATYGQRRGELYQLAGPTSSGKTEIMKEIITQQISNDIKVGLFSFEQQPAHTIQRFVGSALNRRLHIPGEEWNEDDINRELDKIEEKLALYNTCSGHVSIESVLLNIRYLYKCYGIEFFIVDNLKSLAKNPTIEGKRVAVHEYASHCMSEFSSICKQLNINIMVVNHLSEDKISLQAYVSSSPKNESEYLGRTAEGMQSYINRPGMTWETGRMPSIQNIFGGGAIKDLCDYIMVIARNRMSEDDEEHKTIRVKFLKTRLDSNYEGFEFRLKYDYQTGRLTEVHDQDISNRQSEVDNTPPWENNTSVLE